MVFSLWWGAWLIWRFTEMSYLLCIHQQWTTSSAYTSNALNLHTLAVNCIAHTSNELYMHTPAVNCICICQQWTAFSAHTKSDCVLFLTIVNGILCTPTVNYVLCTHPHLQHTPRVNCVPCIHHQWVASFAHTFSELHLLHIPFTFHRWFLLVSVKT